MQNKFHEFSHYGHSMSFCILNHFFILTIWLMPELFNLDRFRMICSGPSQNVQVLDHCRFSAFWTIHDFLHSGYLLLIGLLMALSMSPDIDFIFTSNWLC